jgi:hypothetical protein
MITTLLAEQLGRSMARDALDGPAPRDWPGIDPKKAIYYLTGGYDPTGIDLAEIDRVAHAAFSEYLWRYSDNMAYDISPIRIRSDRTGQEARVFVLVSRIYGTTSFVTEQGDGFGASYAHSELFGGIGTVTVIGEGPAEDSARVVLAEHPPKPDRRTFGRCGSR